MAGTWTQGTKEAYAAMLALGLKRGDFSAKQEYTKDGDYAGVRISFRGTVKDLMARTGLATDPTKALRAGLSLCLFYSVPDRRIMHLSLALSSYNRGGIGTVQVLQAAEKGSPDRLIDWLRFEDGAVRQLVTREQAFTYRVPNY